MSVVIIEMVVGVEVLAVVIVVFTNNEGMFDVMMKTTGETICMNENDVMSFFVSVTVSVAVLEVLDIGVFVLDFLGVKRFGTVRLVTDIVCIFLVTHF